MKNNLLIILKDILLVALGFFIALFIFLPELEFESVSKFPERIKEVHIFAVSNDDEGIYGIAQLRLIPGNDKILLDNNPFNDLYLQYSTKKAVEVAKNVLGIEKTNVDFLFSFNFPSLVLGGESAGAALTILTIAALTNKEINQEVGITGTIELDGSIGPVGGILEKMIAAKESGKSIFLVPKGQSKFYYYEPVAETKGRFFRIYNIRYVKKEIDLKEYAKNELNIELIEVENIYQAMDYFFK
ncbi:MAG: S16 family serine protease [Candidatus Woesearchaeota archaeon]